jgi:hypothetical protein
MKITDCQILFTATLAATRISAPESTPMNKIAALVLEMACAYESDGITFFVSDDPVNALASLYYGSGWLHFGLVSGMLTITPPPRCHLGEPHEVLPPQYREKLEEKACRYAHLLDTALSSVKYAPDPATISHGFAERIFSVAVVYARHGDYLLKTGSREDALASFSYGHGWLDAGVTAGFFRIMAERDIFTV